MDNIITVKQLRKSYGSVEAVRGIDLQVKKGQLFAFLGPNGAGKSTTINILCTLLKADSGSVSINGFNPDNQCDEIHKCIGIVFQDSVLDGVLTVKENLCTRAAFYYSSASQIRKAVEKACEITGIGECLNRPYGKLSGGQKRKADIARALLNTPHILFLDEPTTGLDPQTRKAVWQTVLKLKEEKNTTIFMTTHYMEEAALADEVVIINHGEIVAKGTPSQLKEQYCRDTLSFSVHDALKAEKQLAQAGYAYEPDGGIYRISLKNTIEAIGILNMIQDTIESFEVRQGTMDDVFINVISKEDR